ncbi:ferrous iron transport protein A [Liquorilactobacillus sucicola DSM 21376 = JCM 15457]|uniref:Ferrous iron (Fe2+) uptake protein FeoA n=1 Tax=Liquorilactobacillus sucicola DSM 21376 = JCM 15457 TaxID=1423806 RepID=A0A023D126_9LACO|nr:ferrous iron transport protein A [Liquorilactobacillus sucicola]KRN06398.1 ferrous iron (Fe2+) uptake protein FeoA [Liquorilactobacillus sucicola DSM 21376 = JCM 15457]GAJ27475.1 ferrous iron transport protein A [Liquorilactobacillus sucicola DSM 21376 = JCM 15457]
MESLAKIGNKGQYIIVDVLGERRLAKRLAEMGVAANNVLTVVTVSNNESGMVIYLRGQRLAVSYSMAQSIMVKDVNNNDKEKLVSLSRVGLGKSGVVNKIIGNKELRKRLMDMGLTKNTVVKVHQIAPLGDPIELIVRNYKLSIRKNEADFVLVSEVEVME